MNARQFDPYQLPQCLARPLARGWLNWVQADAALALAAVRHTGSADDWDGVHRILRFLLIQHLKREEARVNAAQGGIWRTVRRLVQDRAPVNRILAEAHDVNARVTTQVTYETVFLDIGHGRSPASILSRMSS